MDLLFNVLKRVKSVATKFDSVMVMKSRLEDKEAIEANKGSYPCLTRCRYASFTHIYQPSYLTNMSTYKNSYKPPPPLHDVRATLSIPTEEYDHNFCFPVIPLSSDRVELRPFIVNIQLTL